MKSKSIVAKACCRVDLAGSTLDIWPLYLFHPGAMTVNFAVNVMTRCEIRRSTNGSRPSREIILRSLDTEREDHFASASALLKAADFNHSLAGYLCRFFLAKASNLPKDGFVLETHSESPAGAGISGSSALMIATTAALAGHFRVKLNKEAIRIIAQNVEAQLIKVPTGCQDYYPALYGGVSAIHLDADGIHREPLAVAAHEIESRFLLVYTGVPRQSGINNWEVCKAHINGDPLVFRNFEEITAIAREMRKALARREVDWKEVARLLHEEWSSRKTNIPGITTPLIESLDWQGKQEDALKAYHDLVYSPNQMVYQSADLGTYLQYVIALIKSKEWELAVTIYEVVKYPPMRLAMFPFPWGTFDPKKPDYIRLQAICHLVLGAQHRRSYRSLPTGYELDHIEAALRLQPKMAEAHYFYAVELTRLKRDFEAKAAFERAATLGNKTVKAAALEKLTKLKLSNKY